MQSRQEVSAEYRPWSLRYVRWKYWFTLVLVCLSLTVWTVITVHAQSTPNTAPNLDVILLIDNSGSMQTSDPEQLRIRATQFLLDYLSANTTSQPANYRAGLANFGGEIGDTFTLRLLPDDTLRNNLRAERIEGTEFTAPLRFAINEFRLKSDPATRKVILLVTDGQPGPEGEALAGVELQDYFDDQLAPMVGELQNLNVELFVLAIGDAQQDRDKWRNLIGDNYIPIEATTDLNNIFYNLVGQLMGLAVLPGQLLPTDLTVQVEPLLEHLTFSFVKSDPTAAISLTDPDGNVLTPTIQSDTDTYHQIYSIVNPPAGNWQIQRRGAGTVEYWIDRRYPAVVVDLNTPFPYSGQPVTITAQLLRNGTVVTRTDDLRLEAEIITPDGDSATFAFEPGNAEGTYTQIFTATRSSGTYTVTARARLNGDRLTTRTIPASIALMPAPLPPTAASGSPVAATTTAPTVIVPTATPSSLLDGEVTLPLWWFLVILMFPIAIATIGVRYFIVSVRRKKTQEEEEISDSIKEMEASANRARNAFAANNFSEAARIASQGLESALKTVRDFFGKIAPPLQDMIDVLSDTGEKLFGGDAWPDSLSDDAASITALKVWIARQTNANKIIEVIDKCLRSTLEQNSLRTTLHCLATHKVNWLTADQQEIALSDLNNRFKVNYSSVEAFEDICNSLYELLNDSTEIALSTRLEDVAKAYDDAGMEAHLANDKRGGFYRYLAKLINFPLYPVEFREIPAEQSKLWQELRVSPVPEQQQHLGQLLQAAFTLDCPINEHREAMAHNIAQLKQIISGLRQPEQFVLKCILDKWQEKLNKVGSAQHPPYDKVQFSLAPELSLEDTTDGTERSITFLIENIGTEPIWNIRLHIKADPGKISFNENTKYVVRQHHRGNFEITPLSRDDSIRLKQSHEPFLYPANSYSFQVKVYTRSEVTVEAKVEYNSYGGHKEKIVDIGAFKMVVNSIDRTVQKTTISEQKYDIPFASDGLIDKKYIKKFQHVPSRNDILDNIITHLKEEPDKIQSLCVNIYGLIRTGKTTLLYQLKDRLHNDTVYLPVYVDYSDLKPLRESSKNVHQWMITGLTQLVCDEAEIFLTSDDMEGKSPFEVLVEAIRLIVQQRHLVLMIDNIDRLVNVLPDETNELIDDLFAVLDQINSRFTLVLTTQSKINTIKPLNKFPINISYCHLKFFSKIDFVYVVNLSTPLKFSGQAIEYLYRITGGSPYLSQILLSYICLFRLETQQNLMINEPVTRQLIYEFMYAHENRRFLRALEPNFEDNERKLISLFDIDPISLVININSENLKDYYSILDSLCTKEFIDKHGEKPFVFYKLRIGYTRLVDDAIKTPYKQATD